MSNVLTDQGILDLVQGTLEHLGPPRFQQIAQSLQEYQVMSHWLKKDKVTIDNGIGIRRAIMTKLPNQARHVGLAAIDDVDIAPLMDKVNIPWRHLTTNMAWERRELLENRGRALIFNIMKPRRAGMMINVAEELEAKAWSSPDVDDELLPYGLPYYVVHNSNTGFNGAAASGHTTCAGINPSTTPQWKNYTGTYSAVTKASLIKMLRTAHRKTGWMSPVTIQDYRGSQGSKYRCYTDEATLSSFEDIGESQNENLGRDVASIDGSIVFRKHPISWIPQLDLSDLDAPFYMIDHSTFYPVVLKGDFLRESKPAMSPNSHNVIVVHIDFTYNYFCIDRRRNTVLYHA